MKKRNVNLPGDRYEPPCTVLVPFETGIPLCDTSVEGNEVEPGTLDYWGTF